MTARVRLVIARSTWRASMLPVSGSTSTNTGVAPACRMALAVAMKVIGVVMTSSPGPMLSALRQRNSALVQLETATACSTPRYVGERLLEEGGARPGRQEHAAQRVGRRGDVVLGQGVAVELDSRHQKTFPL